MMLNWAVEPYNKVEVRWALALATDMVSVTLATFDGMLRVSPLAVPPIEILQQAYHLPMEEWLEEFTLADGYRPFDSDYAVKIADALKQNGVEGIPEDEDELKALFGVGWWKYDVEEAARLLESVGFTRGTDGKWFFPDGTPWQINIVSPVNYEALSERLSYAVAESWSNFGIDAVVNGMDTGSWSSAILTGSYEVANHWNGACASITDIFTGGMMNWHSSFLRPLGVPGGLNPSRINSAEVDAALDALKVVSPNHPQLVELSTNFLEEMVTEMVWIPMVGTSKFVPVTTQWWTGFPNADNYYNGPWWWWSTFKYILPHLETTGNL
jgi:peptide/nickel transport system substrate-binding protein